MRAYQLPNESEEYQQKRAELLKAEMALRDHRERVAELRRGLPQGAAVQDYVFREGPADLSRNDPKDFFDTKLSELFSPGKDSLILMHFMFGPDWEQGCPMCSMWADGYNGAMKHIQDHANFAIVVRAELSKMRTYARERDWHNLRILSSHDNTYTRDFGMERDGDQLPGASVFTRDADGTVRNFYTGGAIMSEGEYRGMDLLSPVWNYYDLLPAGRGEWNPKLSY